MTRPIVVATRLTAKQDDWLDNRARELGTTKADFLRRLIDAARLRWRGPVLDWGDRELDLAEVGE